MILKIFELTKKNFPISEAVDPNAIKTKEKPKVKKIVLTTIKFFFFYSLFCRMMFPRCMKYILGLMVEHKVIRNLLIQLKKL